MKKLSILFGIIAIFAITTISAKSLWLDFSLYRLKIKVGDIIKIRFDEKNIIKYETESRKDNFQSTKGKRGKGKTFDFFPDAEITDSDTIKSKNQLLVKNDSEYGISAMVQEVSGSTVYIRANNNTIVNGETLAVELSGACNIMRIKPDYSIDSTDIYGLNFTVQKQSLTNKNLLSDDDLIFTTNFTDIKTNVIVSTNNITNTVLTTNIAAMQLKFEGIRDSKKKELIINYLNVMINALFR